MVNRELNKSSESRPSGWFSTFIKMWPWMMFKRKYIEFSFGTFLLSVGPVDTRIADPATTDRTAPGREESAILFSPVVKVTSWFIPLSSDMAENYAPFKTKKKKLPEGANSYSVYDWPINSEGKWRSPWCFYGLALLPALLILLHNAFPQQCWSYWTVRCGQFNREKIQSKRH